MKTTSNDFREPLWRNSRESDQLGNTIGREFLRYHGFAIAVHALPWSIKNFFFKIQTFAERLLAVVDSAYDLYTIR